MRTILCFSAALLVHCATSRAAEVALADLVLYNGKVVTVDRRFSIQQSLAVADDRIIAVGSDEDILKMQGPETKEIDLKGKMVLPGLIDSHSHPGAAMTEFDHPIPEMESIQDVLDYFKNRAEGRPDGEWIVLQQVFITRLVEQRYPTRAELDGVAPKHPVMFRTGPDASLNSLALKLSGIDKDFKVTDGGAGFVEKDPATGEPTGILRNCSRFVKVQKSGKQPSEQDHYQRTLQLFKDYLSIGLTTVADRSASFDSIERYQRMLDAGDLPGRLFLSQHVETIGTIEDIKQRIRAVAKSPLSRPHNKLQIIGIKTFLDGGMLTGSAYMREPWGVSEIYSITDPNYRGLLFIPKDRLLPIVQTTIELGLQFTAHSVGDGAVHTLLEVYGELSKARPIGRMRPCITHCNFMSHEAIEQSARLGVVIDIQPAWLYLDARTLATQFGYERLRYFQPLKSLFTAGVTVGGGSDHMQKIGSMRAINPYNPFLGMWTAITRWPKWFDGALHPEEAISREQAIQFYTINNAYLLFKEDHLGSLQPGKLADFVILDRDLLNCPVDEIPDTRVLGTYVGGKQVYKQD